MRSEIHLIRGLSSRKAWVVANAYQLGLQYGQSVEPSLSALWLISLIAIRQLGGHRSRFLVDWLTLIVSAVAKSARVTRGSSLAPNIAVSYLLWLGVADVDCPLLSQIKGPKVSCRLQPHVTYLMSLQACNFLGILSAPTGSAHLSSSRPSYSSELR